MIILSKSCVVTPLVAFVAITVVCSARAQPREARAPLIGNGASTPAEVLPTVRMPSVPIPEGGALVIESPDSSEPQLEVRDESGAVLAGTYWRAGSVYPAGVVYGWLPDDGFHPGTYEVLSTHRLRSSLAELETITVVEASDETVPLLMSSPSTSELSGSPSTKCCESPLGGQLLDQCTVVEQTAVVMLAPGLTSSDPISKLTQYLFRYEPAPGSGASTGFADFTTFEAMPPLVFSEEADEYCCIVSALRVTDLQVHVYSELPSCADRGDLHAGPIRFEPSATFLEMSRCPIPPAELEDSWCEANGEACASGTEHDCEQYEYVCEDGPRPELWRDPIAEVDGGVPRVNVEDVDDEDDGGGCSASGLGSRHASALGWLVLVFALALTATRSRNA